MMIGLPIHIFRVQDKSMEPILHENDYIIVSSFFGKLRVGDLIVLLHPKLQVKIIKKIAKIKENTIFVVGTNEALSDDSRSFGYIDAKNVVGKVLFKA